MPNKTAIGFIGLGQMGGSMAERLLADDVALHIHDPSPAAASRLVARGAIAHDSPRQVADAAAIVFACLPSREVAEAVALGPEGVAQGSAIRVHVEMSTIGKTCIESIADGLAARSIQTVDAPISGGPPAAREGRLAMMAAGPAQAVVQVTPWLARIGKQVYVLGDRPGQAQLMKLINNTLMATNLVAASEGLVMGAKAGLDAAVMFEVLRAGTGHSASADDILARVALPRSFDFGARLSIVEKDVHLGLDEATTLGVPARVMQAAAQIWDEAAQKGWGERDFSSILKLIEERGGAEVRRVT
ncbi:NAD(P)-dependent oxidoreductase [Caballeronia sp. LZ033]|uniref:NAD(P)-dependent oxidoreductase n=1 Tax=Caballeronia sp. LZ033 TaxID=3038566 RepID=UPI002861E16C|nr:NAD(P)-dependent oxidoreductase [Caballeronia sp. LZ033]MDR5814125.1 NAD(P)-dependent oxidoreductase [Caballeronia sp. LZ033]